MFPWSPGPVHCQPYSHRDMTSSVSAKQHRDSPHMQSCVVLILDGRSGDTGLVLCPVRVIIAPRQAKRNAWRAHGLEQTLDNWSPFYC